MSDAAPNRRLATILFADIDGYSRLMRADEERTFSDLRAHLDELVAPVVGRFHGRIVKTVGDGVLVEFASAVEAVRSAVELQRGVTVELEVGGAAPFDEHVRKDHVLFLLESEQLAAVRGPFRDQGGESNQRINGVDMWLESPGLMLQVPSFEERDVKLGGLAPGRYSLRSFPDDLVFEPVSFDVGPAGGRITLRWRRR